MFDDVLEGVTCDNDTPTGPCVKWTGHHDPCSGSNDPLSPFADLEDENADLRMALGAASEELTRLREAAQAYLDAFDLPLTTDPEVHYDTLTAAREALRAALRGDTDAP